MINPIAQAIEDAGGPSRVAHLLDCSVQAACFWRDGKREFPPEHCAVLEANGKGRVRRWHMRPTDWHRIWPELVGAEGAPAVELEAASAGGEAPAAA